MELQDVWLRIILRCLVCLLVRCVKEHKTWLWISGYWFVVSFIIVQCVCWENIMQSLGQSVRVVRRTRVALVQPWNFTQKTTRLNQRSTSIFGHLGSDSASLLDISRPMVSFGPPYRVGGEQQWLHFSLGGLGCDFNPPPQGRHCNGVRTLLWLSLVILEGCFMSAHSKTVFLNISTIVDPLHIYCTYVLVYSGDPFIWD